MDNYDLPNLPLLSQSADSGERLLWMTDEENRRATFSRRSTTASTLDQTELQQLSLAYEEQTSEQKTLADFDLSLPQTIPDPLIVDAPEDPFAALAAHQSLTFEDEPRYPSTSELCLFEGFTAESLLNVVVLAKTEENDCLELSVQPEQMEQSEPSVQPEQPQDELNAKAISIPESANPDTVSGKRSGRRCAPKPRNVVTGDVPESAIKKSQYRSKRLTKKRQKLDSTEIKIVPLSQGVVTRGRPVTKPARSASSKQDTAQNLNESLEKRVKRETEKWIAVSVGRKGRKKYLCSYPDCGLTTPSLGNIKAHIFTHIRISKHKCTYSGCVKRGYFRDSSALQRHILAQHTHEKPYHCTLCDKRYARLDTYKAHLSNIHKIAP